MSEPCRYFINEECTHAPAYEGRKLGKRPSPGGHAACEYNTTAGAWPDMAAPAEVVQVAVNIAISVEHWPWWALALKKRAIEGEKGVGDTLARRIGPIGGDAWNKWYLRITGEKCPSCAARQAALNARYPY